MSVIDLSDGSAPAELTAEICVIGSGCGGATAAWVLAEAGHDVIVLEEGSDRTGRRLTQRDGEMYDQLYMDRGGRSTADLGISVLQGRVLGGGGVINACDVVPISDGVLAFWRERHGLSELTEAAISPYRARALVDLSASRIPDAMVNRANGLLRDGAAALGLRGEVLTSNRVGCQQLGTCLIGCPADAKRNPRFVAIPGAMAAGARFYTRARAVRVEGATDAIKRVHVRTLDPAGYHEQGELVVRASVVIVAANAVATPQLLLRSGIGNAHVGRNLTLQPQLPIMAEFSEPVRGFRGIPQSYAVTEHEQEHHPEHGLWGFRIEGIMGTPGIVASLLPFAGARAKQAMTAYDHMAAALLLAPDGPSGTVTLTGSGRPRVDYEHASEHKARLREAVQVAARIYLAAGATRIIVPTVPPLIIELEADVSKAAELSLAPATAPLLSAHQQGSVRMAASARDGAVDPDGQVYGTRGIYVFDSSWFPSSASSHTMAPILTLSRYLSDKLVARL